MSLGEDRVNVREVLFLIIRQTVLGQKISIGDDLPCDCGELYRLAEKHDLVHLLSSFFRKNGITVDNALSKKINQAQFLAVYRDANQEYVKDILFQTLQKAKIQFVPLKGAMIRPLYIESWMRTSCDLDVLVRENDLDNAIEALLQNGFTTDNVRNYHDVSLYRDGVHVELHFNICESIKRLDLLLQDVWSYTVQANEFEYHENKTFFVFHHIAHMCYHFIYGGCGIKPFIDLYLLKQKSAYDEEKLISLLDKCRIHVFYDRICEVMSVWFDGGQHTDITLAIEQYILDGGVYGTAKNRNKVTAAYHKGRFANAIKIIFPDYQAMCNYYPTVKKHKITLPFFYLIRIFSKLTDKEKAVVKKMKDVTFQDGDTIKETSAFLESLGLN